jgi:ABC-type Fe3+ transport system permease subunit
VDAEQVRREIRQTRASIDRKLELLSSRTSDLAEAAKDTLWCAFAATLVTVGATVAVSWWRRRA